MCLLHHRLLGLCPQSHHPPTKPYKPSLEMLWSIGHFNCSGLILAGKYLLCCKNNGRFTQLVIILPDDRPRLRYFWKHICILCMYTNIFLCSTCLNTWVVFWFFCCVWLLGCFFFSFIWLSLSRGRFWEPKFSCQVGFHLEDEGNNTESAGIFKHLLVCLHDAFILLPGTKWSVRRLFLKRGFSAPFWEPSILPHILPCSLTGWWWQFWGSLDCIVSQFKFLIWNTLPAQTMRAHFLKTEWVDLT